MCFILREKEADLQQKLIKNRRMDGLPIQSGEMTLTPVSQALVVEFPGGMGGISWNRPVGVRVNAPGQEEQYLPVQDITRMAIWAIFGAAFGALMFAWILRRR
jgi:hypothetical protein